MTILTVEEFREFEDTTLSDAALQTALDAAEELILAYAGPPGSATELIDGGIARLALARRASSITSITETVGTTVTTLAADDYRIRAEGYVLERLRTGTNPRGRWHGLVTVIYVPLSDEATREAVQVDLVKLDISSDPGLRSQTIGEFSETFGSDESPEDLRADILSRLNNEPGIRVVGVPRYGVAVW